MRLDQLVKIINREPKSVIVGFVLDSSSRTANDIADDMRGLLGYESLLEMRLQHPGFSVPSIQGYLERSLKAVTEGSKSGGYRLRDEEANARNAARFALQFSLLHNMSLYSALSTDLVAPKAAKLVSCIAEGDDFRIEDLHAKTKRGHSNVSRQLFGLEDAGIVDFERYEGGVEYRWNPEADIRRLETDATEAVYRTARDKKYFRDRIVTTGTYLRDNPNKTFGAIELNHIHGWPISTKAFTQGALRVLQENGYALPTNDFRGGERRTKINITPLGRQLDTFLREVEDYNQLPEIDLSWNDIMQCLQKYNKANCRREMAVTRRSQVICVLKKEPDLTTRQMTDRIGAWSADYLRQLTGSGVLKVTGVGHGESPYRYSLKIK